MFDRTVSTTRAAPRRIGPGPSGIYRRRVLLAGAAVTAGGAVLAACVPPGQQAEPASVAQLGARDLTLRLWHWDSFLIEPYQRTGEQFTQRYPRLKVEVEQTPKAQYVDKLVAQVAGGSPPDTIGVSVTGDFNVVQAKGMVREIDSLLKRDRYDTNDFFEVLLRQHQWRGKRVGLPDSWSTRAWFFNQDLFRTHGVKTPYEHWKAGTWTWDTYLDTVQRFNRVGDGVFGTTSLPAWQNVTSFPLVWSNNGDIFDAQYTKAVLDQAPALETWEFMYKASQLAPQGEQARTSTIATGKIAMWVDWDLWYQLNLKTMAFTYSMAPPPASPKTKRHVGIATSPGFSIVTETKNQDEAWALLTHLVAPESLRRLFLEANLQSVRKSQFTSKEFWRSHPALPDPNLMFEIADAGFKNARVPPRISNFPDLQRLLREEFEAAWQNKQSVRDAALKASERATQLLKEAEIDR